MAGIAADRTVRHYARGKDFDNSLTPAEIFHSKTHRQPIVRLKKGTQRYWSAQGAVAERDLWLTTFRSKGGIRYAITGGGE